ncbi:hypothetical protein V8E51_015927 [Hyaloscypha variabilis]
MYRWYEQSAVCFVYLSDVSAKPEPDSSTGFRHFKSSCWFKRGWTLQELIAPPNVEFYTSDWTYVGVKSSIAYTLKRITSIDVDVLLGTKSARACSVAMIMSWASGRKTTRKEDIAYCLMGLFGIHMPLLYGEGERAFIRLQEEILKQSSDQSLFAWDPIGKELDASSPALSLCGIFAQSPICFADTGHIRPLPEFWATESTLTNRGIRLRMPFKYDKSNDSFLAILCCTSYGFDVALEFYSPSHSLGDLDHLVRISRCTKYGHWSYDPQIDFRQVYLTTEIALSHAIHTSYSGLEGLQAQYHFHLFTHDLEDQVNRNDVLELYPPEALSKVVEFEMSLLDGNFVAILNPLQARHNSVAIQLPIEVFPRIALVLGFGTLKNGLADVKQPWVTITPMDELESVQGVWSKIKSPPSSEDGRTSSIIIGKISILAKLTEQPWSIKSPRCIRIYSNPVPDATREVS